MSISSILAFVIAGVAAKTKSVQVARPSEDVAELKAKVAELEGAVEQWRKLHSTVEDAIATANVNARRDQELIDMWRERALLAEKAIATGPQPPPGFGALRPAGPDFRPPEVALRQAAAQMQNAQLAQYQYAQQQSAYQHGMQGMQALGQAQSLMDTELWCNCVPARHDMFLPRGG
jgi:outer membrane murein-binding lipoprotein Lpp